MSDTSSPTPPPAPDRHRLTFAAVCLGAAALIAGGVMLVRPHAGAQVEVSGLPAVGGPFHLTDQNGKPATEALLKGKWSAVFFGYTFCPDVCPTTLQTLGAAQDRLGPKGRDLQVVFVSVDPERDTPATLKTYLSNRGFPVGAVGLTGTPSQVAEAAKAYKVYYAKNGTGADYQMDHSVATYLMNPQGRFVKVLPDKLSPDQVADLIRDAMREG